jgi:hypothetical protein
MGLYVDWHRFGLANEPTAPRLVAHL